MASISTKVTAISLSDKDEWKKIIANAKFTEIAQLLKTKVGINNFIHLILNFETSILLRDIIVNSPFVSAWGRSTQVLNKTDSAFSIYRPVCSDYEEYHKDMICSMEKLYAAGHIQDNIRMLVPLGSITNYAISIDIMTCVKLILVLDQVDGELRHESQNIANQLFNIIEENYGITDGVIRNIMESYLYDIDKDFQYMSKDLSKITGLEVISAPVTYSVIGQIIRHRTVFKNFNIDLIEARQLTENYDYNFIETPIEISKMIKDITRNCNSVYQLLQGSILTVNFSGFVPYIKKMFNQRSCCINDTKQFAGIMQLDAIPPCKCNVQKFGCYVEYVNQSRLKNEELTQTPCPIWAESQGIRKYTDNPKYNYFYNNIKSWKKWHERITK
jgi:hypothetical protein